MKDPFSILGLDETATKKDIMARVAQALRDDRYDAKTIATAQKTLFNPSTRAQAEFRYRIDFGPYAEEIPEPLNEDCSIERLLL
uniref:Molecular chaperone DnaJ n=1 Tax=Candidatus Kentrum sp. LPFa TaxID=2126335 RepID=A0A450VZN8_9GAMM|nr:MAG: hypothetical protein BECKLPF1236B_GA0070989_10145 [Candidatus Kentron sp. LPFa]